MQVRSKLAAGQLEGLYEFLNTCLDGVGLSTRPEIAARVLDLAADPSAGLTDYADVVRADVVLTGRLLRVSNSAFYAQRRPVTTLDRACILLGLERIKAISLGVYLSRAVAGGAGEELSRRIWGESLFRAFLAKELAHEIVPGLCAEAFVVGLMLDAGVPLMHHMLREQYAGLVSFEPGPAERFRAEFETLPYTHVDVMAALARRWRLPEILARPIEWHHTPPGEGDKPVHALHRIAWCVGMLRVRPQRDGADVDRFTSAAAKVLGCALGTLAKLVGTATEEYKVSAEVFAEVAAKIGGVETLAEKLHARHVAAVDDMLGRALDGPDQPLRVAAGGRAVDLMLDGTGGAVAVLYGSDGRRLMAHPFDPHKAAESSPAAIAEALGMDAGDEKILAALAMGLDAFLSSLDIAECG
jgi:HD-like signal output (HDOD) protein